MGDRTSVTLGIPNALKEQAKTIIGQDYDTEKTAMLAYFTFEQVNYGELDFLDALQAAGIAYDSGWEAGDEYGPGCKSCRFTSEGEAIVKEIYDTELDPPMSTLIQLIDQAENLRDFILQYKAERTLLPWANQEEYGKLYRAHMLIAPQI